MLAQSMLSSCVCLSVTRVYCTKTAKNRITQNYVIRSQGLYFCDAKDDGEIPTASSPKRAQIQLSKLK